MRYLIYIKAEEYIEIEADNITEAHQKAQDLAPQVARNFETEIIRELN